MVYTLLATGFEEIEALTVVDILRRAEIPVKMVSVTDNLNVTGAHGIEVVADCLLSGIEDGELLFLPGGLPGVTNLEASKAVVDLIKKYASTEKYISAICAAPSILGKLGLLNGRKATCYPSFEKYLDGAEHLTEKVVIDGNFITSRGAGTASDLGFKIVSLLKVKELAEKLKSGMIYD